MDIKKVDPKLKTTVCMHAPLNRYYVTELRSCDDWDRVCLLLNFFRDVTERTVESAHKYGKSANIG